MGCTAFAFTFLSLVLFIVYRDSRFAWLSMLVTVYFLFAATAGTQADRGGLDAPLMSDLDTVFVCTYLWVFSVIHECQRKKLSIFHGMLIFGICAALATGFTGTTGNPSLQAVHGWILALLPWSTLIVTTPFWKPQERGATGLFFGHITVLLLFLTQTPSTAQLILPASLRPHLNYVFLVCLFTHMFLIISLTRHASRRAGLIEKKLALRQMEEEVLKRTEDLRMAREGAERMAALQRNFLATMSHELRTPLASVVGLSRMLAEYKDLPERARHDMGTIERMAVQLLRMVDEGLAFVRQRGREEPFTPQLVNMRHLLRDTESVSRWLSQQQGNRFVMLRIKRMPQSLYFDERRMRQVIINLVSNAGRYCQNGDISLGVNLDNIEGQEILNLLVSDSGRGMSPEEIGKIFEPFVKSRDSQGLGLGLALVKKLVHEMNGNLRVISQVGMGTQFYVSIPVSLEDLAVDTVGADIPDDDQLESVPVSRPMALLSGSEICRLDLDKLRAQVRLGQFSEIEEWLQRCMTYESLSFDAMRFIAQVKQAIEGVNLNLIETLIDQIDTPVNRA